MPAPPKPDIKIIKIEPKALICGICNSEQNED
jgi:hypothetical protein